MAERADALRRRREAGPRRRHGWIGAGLVLFAAARVLAYASAYPFFNGVDEHQHFDAVVKYGRGLLPGDEEMRFEPATAQAILRLASPEYLRRPEEMPGGRVPTPEEKAGKLPDRAPAIVRARRRLEASASLQHSGPPLYYALAGVWYDLGLALGLRGLASLYFVRWLDALLVAGLVGVSFVGLRRWRPGEPLLYLGAPAVLAFLPNDFEYSISNDVLSPVLGAAAFFALLAVAEAARPRRASLLAAGAAVAACFLTKYSNLYLAAVAAVAFACWLRRWRRRRAPLAEVAAWGWAVLAAALPAGLWVLRNLLVVGSPTGQHRKIARAGWTLKPVSDWLDHPIYSLEGIWAFLSHFFAILWSGEISWGGEPLRLAALDDFQVASSIGLLGLAAAGWALRRPAAPFAPGGPRPALEGLALAAVGSALGILAFLSTVFDFGYASRPDNDFPYLASGRYVATFLLPFAVLYVRGLEVLCAPLPGAGARRAPWVLLGTIGITVTVAEAWLSIPVFRSPWNWFHAT